MFVLHWPISKLHLQMRGLLGSVFAQMLHSERIEILQLFKEAI